MNYLYYTTAFIVSILAANVYAKAPQGIDLGQEQEYMQDEPFLGQGQGYMQDEPYLGQADYLQGAPYLQHNYLGMTPGATEGPIR